MRSSRPTVVYVCRDGDVVAYVGITRRLVRRRATHRRRSWWWTPTTSMTVVDAFVHRSDARARERALIEELRPLYNVQHANPTTIVRRPAVPREPVAPPPSRSAAAILVELQETQARMARYERDAASHRGTRDGIVRELRAEDPERWTYPALAQAVGCSPELVAAIVKDRPRKSRRR